MALNTRTLWNCGISSKLWIQNRLMLIKSKRFSEPKTPKTIDAKRYQKTT